MLHTTIHIPLLFTFQNKILQIRNIILSTHPFHSFESIGRCVYILSHTYAVRYRYAYWTCEADISV